MVTTRSKARLQKAPSETTEKPPLVVAVVDPPEAAAETEERLVKRQKKTVQFNKIIRKKEISPLPDKVPGEVRIPGDCSNNNEPNSFIILTDHSLTSRIELAHRFVDKSCIKMGLSKAKKLGESAKYTLWTDAFLPTNDSEIIPGPSMDGFANWIKRWKNKLPAIPLIVLDKEPPKKKSRRQDSDDEEYCDDNDHVDIPTTFVLSGPTGCGKTSFVHYFAKKNGFNVIEVSASDDRSGSIMQRLLNGAMENHNVHGRGDIRSMFGPKRTSSNNSVCRQNLVLIDDADIVYRSDKNFWTTVSTFSVETRIPIVLTCTNSDVVLGNMENSDFESCNFWKRETKTIERYLKDWINGFAGITFDENPFHLMIKECKQDVRKALNNLQFYGALLSCKDELESNEPALSSQTLAELDAILTQCETFERKTSKVLWTSKIKSDINFVPDKDPCINWDIPSVNNDNEDVIAYLKELMLSRRPPTFQKLDDENQKLSACLLSCRGLSAPVLTAIYDAHRRSYLPSRPRISAMYELPALCVKHRAWHERIQNGSSRKRVLHPFDQVDTEMGKALDRYGNLRKTINEYLYPSCNP